MIHLFLDACVWLPRCVILMDRVSVGISVIVRDIGVGRIPEQVVCMHPAFGKIDFLLRSRCDGAGEVSEMANQKNTL